MRLISLTRLSDIYVDVLFGLLYHYYNVCRFWKLYKTFHCTSGNGGHSITFLHSFLTVLSEINFPSTSSSPAAFYCWVIRIDNFIFFAELFCFLFIKIFFGVVCFVEIWPKHIRLKKRAPQPWNEVQASAKDALRASQPLFFIFRTIAIAVFKRKNSTDEKNRYSDTAYFVCWISALRSIANLQNRVFRLTRVASMEFVKNGFCAHIETISINRARLVGDFDKHYCSLSHGEDVVVRRNGNNLVFNVRDSESLGHSVASTIIFKQESTSLRLITNFAAPTYY